MLKKSQRLEKNEFTRVFQKGKAFHSEHFTIKWTPPLKGYSRFGISCGLRVSKKATVRNRIKRRLFATIHLHYSKVIPGDYIIMTKPTILFQSFSQIQSSFLHTLRFINEKHSPRVH